MLQPEQALDALLPQWQCGLCGHGGCQPYAAAMAQGLAPPNRCPPGGIAVLQDLLNTGLWPDLQQGVPRLEIAPDCAAAPSGGVATIDEQWCIGCTKCIAVCPVDAIIGANKKMHTVLQAACTGCDLCLPVCPVDCISMLPRANTPGPDTAEKAVSRQRAAAKRDRIALVSSQTNKPEEVLISAAASAQKASLLASVLARSRRSVE